MYGWSRVYPTSSHFPTNNSNTIICSSRLIIESVKDCQVHSVHLKLTTHLPWQAAMREEPLKPYGHDTQEQYDISLKHADVSAQC